MVIARPSFCGRWVLGLTGIVKNVEARGFLATIANFLTQFIRIITISNILR